jgi:hypothetical protein
MSDKPIVDDLSFEDIETVTKKAATAKKTKAPPKTKTTPVYRQGALIEPLTRFYATMGIGTMPFAPRTAEAIINQAEECAKAWDDWARTSPTVRRLLYPLLNVSAGAAVFAAHLPILLSVAMEMRPNSPFADQVENYLSKVTPNFGEETENVPT